MKNKADWARTDERNLVRREQRADQRDRSLPKSRICSWCRQGPLMSSRQWVVVDQWVGCKKCWTRRSLLVPEKKIVKVDVTLFTEPETKYLIDGYQLTHCREQVGKSQGDFASIAGWSRQYQSKLEGGRVKFVTQEVANTIIAVFQRIGVETHDQIR